MKHLIICREYPPAPPGGIGTYVDHMSLLLAEHGETVHVIGQLWPGAERILEERCAGKLIIHRLPFEYWTADGQKVSQAMESAEARGLAESSFPAQSFSWQAALLAERLIEQEGIDIIEAQEYEAPLYYLQLRGRLGLGPGRQPPCIVHLHSLWQFIARYDDWDEHHILHSTAKRLEDDCIRAADALLCPSRYLARQVEAHYGLKQDSVHIIPYPLGHSEIIGRDARTWEEGSICYMGRLERRKGVLEWIDAAVSVAAEHPNVTFDFVGANILGTSLGRGEDIVRERIPESLRPRFCFHGRQERAQLPAFLARARVAVVPSRWENFPNVCMEAMGTGLPVLVSCEGGMIEMIEDGRTGWIARSADREGLAEALRRALHTSGTQLAAMGREAAVSIRRLCDNETIVQQQLDFRAKVVGQGAVRSIHLMGPSWIKQPVSAEVNSGVNCSSDEGIGLIVRTHNNGRDLDACLASAEQQTRKFSCLVIADAGSVEPLTLAALEQAQRDGWDVIRMTTDSNKSALNAGLEWIRRLRNRPQAVAFLDVNDRLHPDYVAVCEQVFSRDPQTGLVSSWALDRKENNRLWTRPSPEFPYQWLASDIVPFAAVRLEALGEPDPLKEGWESGYDLWDMFDTVLASGWRAVTVPQILGEAHFQQPAKPYMPDPYRPVNRSDH